MYNRARASIRPAVIQRINSPLNVTARMRRCPHIIWSRNNTRAEEEGTWVSMNESINHAAFLPQVCAGQIEWHDFNTVRRENKNTYICNWTNGITARGAEVERGTRDARRFWCVINGASSFLLTNARVIRPGYRSV